MRETRKPLPHHCSPPLSQGQAIARWPDRRPSTNPLLTINFNLRDTSAKADVYPPPVSL
ncbi:hypothetical protein E1H18_3520 [Caulobacter sp. RHG1]|nr:hypothetical protein [Caulobacter sp. RHG1]